MATNCSSCGAEILWTYTDKNGKAMPLDVVAGELDAKGNPPRSAQGACRGRPSRRLDAARSSTTSRTTSMELPQYQAALPGALGNVSLMLTLFRKEKT